MNKTTVFRALSFLLLVGWMIFIFAFSSQNAEKSSQTSSGFVSAVIETVYPQYNTLSASQQQNVTHTVTLIVRKTAHFSEYFVLGLLAFLTTVTFNKHKLCIRLATAFVFCVLYSISDEIHQHFVPGRACRLIDMLIDSAGSMTAILLLTVLFVKRRKFRSKSGDKNA